MDFKEYALSSQKTFCLELERVELLLDKCFHPEKQMKIIHVAGTNGKGSVSAFVSEGLIYGGETVGKYSSPELFSVCDTITVNSVPIRMSQLEDIYARLAPLCLEVEAETGKAPSQFEINFVSALVFFKDMGCTYGVIECGMGGLGDATNAMCDSLVSVITKVSLDHESYLGNTVEKIAENKCGIFKKSSQVVTGFQEETVMNVIEKMAQPRSVTVAKSPTTHGFDGFSEVISFDDGEKIKLSLFGVHQAQNAAIASQVLNLLGFGNTVKYALEHAKNPARLEQTEENVYFDGAHNPDGVRRLAESINRYCPDGKKIFVIGFMADKDYKNALCHLKTLSDQNFEIYTVTVHSNSRSETAQNLCHACMELGFEATPYENIAQAVCEAKKAADFVFAFGSLYMYKEYRKL